MTATTPAHHRPVPHRPSMAARRTGYTIAAVVNVALLWAVNVSPGWRILPFLTDATGEVLGLVNASLYAAFIVNLIYVTYDPPWLRGLGDMIVNGIGLVAVIRVWQVFPFDFTGAAFDAALLTRWILAVGAVGATIGLIAQFVRFVGALTREDEPAGGRR